MKLEHVSIGGFGRFADFDSGQDALGSLVVVLGPNEAGKSTLFDFIGTMLYGFRPASRDTNPYVPWDSDVASGSVRIRLSDGGCAEVERSLRSSPSAKLSRGGRTESINNRAVPWVQHVPRAVFDQVYAITLGELAGLDAETWAGIQDRLVGAMGASDLLSARAVAAELEQEAGGLWRPTRHGKQRVRQLREELQAVRARRRAVEERERELRGVYGELQRVAARLDEATEELERERIVVDRIETLAPVRRNLARVATLRAEAGDRSRLDGLPADPAAALSALDARIAELADRLEDLDAAEAETVPAVDEADEAVLARAEEIRALDARARAAHGDRAKAASLELDLAENERAAAARAEVLFTAPWSEISMEAVAAVRTGELRSLIHELSRIGEERRIASAAGGAQPSPADAVPPVALAAGAVGGVALTAWGLASGQPAATLLGGVLLAAAAVLGLQRPRSRPADPEDLDASERAAREAFARAVGQLPLRAQALETPDHHLVVSIESLQELAADHERRTRALAQCGERVRVVESGARALASALGHDTALDLDALVHLLTGELARAERAREATRVRRDDGARRARERGRIERDSGTAAAERAALSVRIADIGDASVERGIEVVREAHRSHDLADQIEAELERTHPDLPSIRERIAEAEAGGEGWTLEDDELARRRAAIERLGEERVELSARREALVKELEHARGGETVDSIDGEAAALEEEIERLVRDRDRRWVLGQLLRDADRRFREEHQPDVLRRAGRYFEHLTGGRYRRILVDETGSGDVFQVEGPALPRPVPLGPPLSTGTLEQAYLALRLAIVDHLDEGGERLPLVLDEALVNWDDERRSRGLEALVTVARTRQVFVFTCHPDLAAALTAAEAQLLDLSAGP